MKGAFPVLMFAFMGIAVVVGIVATNIFVETETIKRSIRDASILEAINNVEFLKNSLNQALAYSFYQASYEVAKAGGNTIDLQEFGTVDYWRINSEEHAPNFESNIEAVSLNILKEYVTALKVDGIENPDYTSVDLMKDGDGVVKVDAISSKNIFTSSKVYEITDVGSMTRIIQSNIFPLFEEPIRVFVEGDLIQDLAKEAKDESWNGKSWPEGGEDTDRCSCGTSTNSCVSDSEVFSEETGYSVSAAESAIASYLEGKLDELAETNWVNNNFKNKFTTTVMGKEVEVNIELDCDADRDVNENSEGQCTSVDVTKECDFDYYISGDVQLRIEDELKYPVFDSGETSRRSVAVNFGVRSCNVYSSKCPL